MLSVSAERGSRTPGAEDKVVLAERPQGHFERKLYLSDNLDTDRIEAHYEHERPRPARAGVLEGPGSQGDRHLRRPAGRAGCGVGQLNRPATESTPARAAPTPNAAADRRGALPAEGASALSAASSCGSGPLAPVVPDRNSRLPAAAFTIDAGQSAPSGASACSDRFFQRNHLRTSRAHLFTETCRHPARSGTKSTPTEPSSAASPPKSPGAARQAQTDLRPPYRHRRPRHRGERRQGRDDRRQGRQEAATTATPAIPAASARSYRDCSAKQPEEVVAGRSAACSQGGARQPNARQAQGVRRPHPPPLRPEASAAPSTPTYRPRRPAPPIPKGRLQCPSR